MATIPVHSGDNLQTAINSASAGDVLVLDDGATFTGNFTLPVHSGSTAITIQGQTVPTAGVRVSPAGAVNFPKIQASAGGDPAINTTPGCHDWTFIGIDFPPTPSGFNDIIRLGDGSSAQNDVSQVPYNLTIDRCYIHGDVTVGQKRGIALNSGATNITNCYICEIKVVGQDCQAIGGWNGTGPYFIDNNYLEGSGENVLIGGATTYIVGNIPSDITITNNDIVKPIAWRSQSWSVKNLLELKAGRRVVIDSNNFDYCWAESQVGIPILFTVRNQDFDPTHSGDISNNYWNNVQDVQFTRNTVRHVGGAISVLGHEDRIISGTPVPSGTLSDLLIQDNLFWDVSQDYGGSARFLQIQYGDGITVNHNTCIANQPSDFSVACYFINQPCTNFTFTNNIAVCPSHFGQFLQSADDDNPSLNGLHGTACLDAFAAPYTFTSNVIIGGTSTGFPAGNFYPASILDVVFVDLAGNDYRLDPASPYHNAASDGDDVGARFASSSPPVSPTLSLDPSSLVVTGSPTGLVVTEPDGVVKISLELGEVFYLTTGKSNLSQAVDEVFVAGDPPVDLTQNLGEVFIQRHPPVDLTQLIGEIFITGVHSHNMTQTVVEVWYTPGRVAQQRVVRPKQWRLYKFDIKLRKEENA